MKDACPFSQRYCEFPEHDWYGDYFADSPRNMSDVFHLIDASQPIFSYYCPVALSERPDVKQALSAFSWYEKQQLAMRHPYPTVEFLRTVEAVANGINAAEAAGYEDRKRERGKK